MSKPLLMENLHEYDQGALQVLFDRAMREVYLDMEDRPALKKKRGVSLHFEFKPTSHDNELDGIETVVMVKTDLPNKECRVNLLAPGGKADGIMFDPDTRVTRTVRGQTNLEFEDE